MQRLGLAAAALVSLVLTAGCTRPEPPAEPVPAAPRDAAAASGEALTLAVVPKAVSQQFWTTVKAGAEAAAAELGATVIWKGPDSETDTATQKSILEDFITQRVDAIVMAATDADALVPTIEQAEAAKIPVITIDSGVNADVRCLVSTDNVAGAQIAGEALIELIGGKGKVGLIPFVKGAASSNDREAGFKQAVAAAAGVELVATAYSESDEGKGKDAAADMLTANPDLAGIFAANEAGVVGAANALLEAKKTGTVKLVGFDGSPAEVELLRRGAIQALVVQNPFKMGYEGVRQAVLAVRGESIEKRVDTGVTVVTAENVDTPEVRELLNPTAAQ